MGEFVERSRRVCGPMTTRRAVLKGGIATATAITAWRGGLAHGAPLDTHRPDHFVLDPGSAVSALLAGHARAASIPYFATSGDITSLWFEILDVLWRRRPSTVIGVTSPEAIFCLERLAWDHGMRMEYRVDQVAHGSGTALRVRGRRAALEHRPGVMSDDRWLEPWLASRLLECPVGSGASTECTWSVGKPMPDFSWVGWVIAPRLRA